MSCLPLKPSSRSTASSTGRPWQSQPGLPRHEVALHRAVPREDVLEDAGFDMVGAWSAIRGWRSLVEGPQWGDQPNPGALARRPLSRSHRSKIRSLHGRQVDLRGHGVIHGASCPSGQDSAAGVGVPVAGDAMRRSYYSPIPDADDTDRVGSIHHSKGAAMAKKASARRRLPRRLPSEEGTGEEGCCEEGPGEEGGGEEGAREEGGREEGCRPRRLPAKKAPAKKAAAKKAAAKKAPCEESASEEGSPAKKAPAKKAPAKKLPRPKRRPVVREDESPWTDTELA
jgi:hypothetical protein